MGASVLVVCTARRIRCTENSTDRAPARPFRPILGLARRQSGDDFDPDGTIRPQLGEKQYRRLRQLLKPTRRALDEIEGLALLAQLRRAAPADAMDRLRPDDRVAIQPLIERLHGAAADEKKQVNEAASPTRRSSSAQRTAERADLRIVSRGGQRRNPDPGGGG